MNYATINFDHLKVLNDMGLPVSVVEYVFLDQVANMQKSAKFNHWCVMPNDEFCQKLQMSDSGLRKMQAKLEGLGLLIRQEGNKTGKKATPLFTDTCPSQSSGLLRHKVADSPLLSSDKKEKKITEKETNSAHEENEVPAYVHANRDKALAYSTPDTCPPPFQSPNFATVWQNWQAYLAEKGKPATRTQLETQGRHLRNLTTDEQTAVKIVNQAIAGGYTSFRSLIEQTAKPSASSKQAQQKATYTSPTKYRPA